MEKQIISEATHCVVRILQFITKIFPFPDFHRMGRGKVMCQWALCSKFKPHLFMKSLLNPSNLAIHTVSEPVNIIHSHLSCYFYKNSKHHAISQAYLPLQILTLLKGSTMTYTSVSGFQCPAYATGQSEYVTDACQIKMNQWLNLQGLYLPEQLGKGGIKIGNRVHQETF